MNEKQLQQMTSKKGFIAALDQSGGSTPKASADRKITFLAAGAEETGRTIFSI